MAMMFGRFEIQSELSKSDTALVYKAMDMKADQVVALKTQSLERLGRRVDGFVNTLIEEGENSLTLASQNIVVLYGAGEIDGQFCAAMEYIQGNSIATMLARKEGFSIWDLLDVTRQVCAGLEHASSKGVAHCSLEPAKIMVQWDGMVKILGYGISNMSLIEAEAGRGLGRLMPYCSPEQIRGEAIDLRSNIFTLGTILYEMVTDRKAFDASDPVALVKQIEDATPANPSSVNAKIHPALGELIMKALAKDPAERYPNARTLVEDLEKCKESTKKAVTEPKKPTATPKAAVNSTDRAAAASKFASGTPIAAKPAPSAPSSMPPSVSSKPVSSKPAPAGIGAAAISRATPAKADRRVAATAAGAGNAGSASSIPMTAVDSNRASDSSSDYFSTSASNFASSFGDSNSDSSSGARLIDDFEIGAVDSQHARGPVLSSTAVEQEAERSLPRGVVDPLMSETGTATSGRSFSELAEMPPFKEPVFTPPVTEPADLAPPVPQIHGREYGREYAQEHAREEEPRIQPREVAKKAFNVISTIPPRLMLFSILGALGLILVIAIAVFFRVRSDDDGSTAAPQPTAAVNPSKASTSTQPITPQPAQRIEKPVPPVAETQPRVTVRKVEKRGSNSNRKTPVAVPVEAVAPVVLSGQALIDSNPQGAQFQVDGKNDPAWVTPFKVANLSPGKHIIALSKTGYAADIRSVEVAGGSQSSLMVRLAPVNALAVVSSTPPGADVVIDGKPTGRVTPSQFALEKGSHTFLVRKQGYLEETTTADLGPAQNFQYSPTLRALGNTEDMRTIGKFNRLFGRGGESTAGMGSILVRTQPKGAQVAINQQILEKTSPVGVALAPGNYIVDITLTGFKAVHKIISIDKGNKAAIDEILERQ